MTLQVYIIISGLSYLYGDDLGAGLLETARIADDVGIDQLVMTDHLAMGARTEHYPYGRFPYPNSEPWPEPRTNTSPWRPTVIPASPPLSSTEPWRPRRPVTSSRPEKR